MYQFLGYRIQKSGAADPYKNTGVIFKDEEKAKAYCADHNMGGLGFVSFRYVEEYLEYEDDKFNLDEDHRIVYNQFSGRHMTLSEYNEYMSNMGFGVQVSVND